MFMLINWLVVTAIVNMPKVYTKDRKRKICAWNANGIYGQWCHLDDIRAQYDIPLVTDHKLFNAELHKLAHGKSYSIYPVASKTLPDKKIGRGLGMVVLQHIGQ